MKNREVSLDEIIFELVQKGAKVEFSKCDDGVFVKVIDDVNFSGSSTIAKNAESIYNELIDGALFTGYAKAIYSDGTTTSIEKLSRDIK